MGKAVSRSRTLNRLGLAAVLTLMLGVCLLAPPSASAAPQGRAADRNCSDFSSQRAAQDYFIARGGPTSDPDRLDADHDGIACENNPCPCGRTPSSNPRPKPTPRPKPRPRPLPSLFSGKCQRGPFPTRRCTPGAVVAGMTAQRLCNGDYNPPGPISPGVVRAVMNDYGIRRNLLRFALDRLVPVSLGGTNARRNLWAQAIVPAGTKYEVVVALKRALCAGRIALGEAQRRIRSDWRQALAGLGTYFFNQRQGYLEAPESLDFCSSGCEYDGLQWTGWNTNVATASGDYAPVTSGTVDGRWPVTIQLSQPRTCSAGIRIYTHYVEDYPGDVPTPDFQRHQEMDWTCNGHTVDGPY
jgi:hypothetical protein